MFKYRFLKGLVIFMGFTVPSIAADSVPAWQITPQESEISFTAIQTNAPVKGKFTTFTGTIAFDPAQLDKSTVDIMIDVDSMSDLATDIISVIKKAEWFDLDDFKKAHFVSKSFVKVDDKKYQAKGELTIRDKTMPITLSFVLDEFSKSKAQVTGSTTLSRTAFDVGKGAWASPDIVKDEVQVDFKISATPK
jgi:polyisoprenoid-binding protein YceI